MAQFYEMTAVALREEIRKGQIGVEELTRAYLDRIDKYDQSCGLNSVAVINDSVIEDARKLDERQANRDLPLFGLPVLVKDNIDVAGLYTTAGSLALTDNAAIADAPVIRNLRRNGALILGKTNMTEFANYVSDDMPNGYSSRGGQVVHAYDPAKDPGGSSTGSGVAMSMGFAAACVGTDTSFSVVGCAQKHGITGFKPIVGSISSQGIVPICHTLDTAGPMTKTVSDAILMYSAMREQGFDSVIPTDPRELKLAVNCYNEETVPQEHRACISQLYHGLQSAGVTFTEVNHPSYPEIDDIMCYEFRHDLERYLAGSGASRKTLAEIVDFYEADPSVRMKYGINVLKDALEKASGRMDDPAYLTAMKLRQRVQASLIEELKEIDAVIVTGRTNVMHFAGLPSMAVPVGMADPESPVGILMYGLDERRLLAAALTVERFCSAITMPQLRKGE